METASAAAYFLSPQQAQLWLAQQTTGLEPLAQIAVLVEGPLAFDAVLQSLDAVIARHESLRTVFRRSAGMKTPFQVVQPSLPAVVEQRPALASPLQTAQSVLNAQASAPFDLETGPLLRLGVAQLAAGQHVLALTAPALAADAASLERIVVELLTPAIAAEEPLRYVQFAQWQSELLTSDDEAAEQGRALWQQRAASGEQWLKLPEELPAPASDAPPAHRHYALQPVLLAPATQQAMKSAALALQATPEQLLLAVWQAALHRLTGKTQLATGVVMPNREYDELTEAVGLISRQVPLHLRFDGNPRFDEIVGQARTALAEATGLQEYLNPETSFTQDAAVGFCYQASQLPAQVAHFSLQTLALSAQVAGAKLQLNACELAAERTLALQYDPTRYSERAIAQVAEVVQTLLAAALAQPQQLVARLPVLSPATRERMLTTWNQTAAPYPQQTVTALFEQQAHATPHRPAVRCGEEALSYAQLNEQANQLAHALRAAGVAEGSVVGLCLDRSTRVIVAMLAVLKAGGAYVVLSPDHPTARLAQQLQPATAVITERQFAAHLPQTFGPAGTGLSVVLEDAAQSLAALPISNPEPVTTPEGLAYVLYTSGSTGQPKGVAVRHRNLVNYTWAIRELLQLAQYPDGLHFASVSTLGADLGNTAIFPALLSGGCLHVVPYDIATDSAQLAAYQRRHPYDVLKIVPSHLAALFRSQEAAQVLPRRYLITGGELLQRALVDEILASGATCQLINHYGPTETTVGSLAVPVDQTLAIATAGVPIGRPLANTRGYILDAYLEPVPEGVAGELYLAGDGVTAGYLGQPQLTAERFVPNPFVAVATMYRTGDMARFVPGTEGMVEFLGRSDDQVKVRGYRIELGEVESALLHVPGVKDAAVAVRTSATGEKSIAAYTVPSQYALTRDQVLESLRQQLPDAMIPAEIFFLEKLPLTANGKVDRKALLALEPAVLERAFLEAATPTEQAVVAIWQQVLGRPRISADDNFFALGGHSLMATQVVSRVRQHFNVEIALRALFEAPVLQQFAALVDASTVAVAPQHQTIGRASREAYRTSSK
ncbi:MAG: amino acid adenylation domain-containing protein [Acidobacteriota bacterium]|nr:amino acid adenylation domain-containing protein [Acidobacteriota bacterium]